MRRAGRGGRAGGEGLPGACAGGPPPGDRSRPPVPPHRADSVEEVGSWRRRAASTQRPFTQIPRHEAALRLRRVANPFRTRSMVARTSSTQSAGSGLQAPRCRGRPVWISARLIGSRPRRGRPPRRPGRRGRRPWRRGPCRPCARPGMGAARRWTRPWCARWTSTGARPGPTGGGRPPPRGGRPRPVLSPSARRSRRRPGCAPARRRGRPT